MILAARPASSDPQFQRHVKLQRLKTRDQFQAVLAGFTAARTSHFALHCSTLDVPVPDHSTARLQTTPAPVLFNKPDVWVGAMVPKRWAKRAVTRNAIRRQIYCVSTDFSLILPVAAHVVRLRASFDRARFTSAWSDRLKTAVRQELLQLFAQARVPTATPTLPPGAA